MTRPPSAATLVAAHQITPAMRRLVVGGPEIARFATPVGALGPYLKLRLFGLDGTTAIRTYSIRRFDPIRTELQIDIVMHDRPSVGSAFAAGVQPGAPVTLGGPGFIPADPCGAYLLAGDQTAVPAIAHIIENMPGGSEIRAVIEVPDRAEEQTFGGPAADITWLHRAPCTPSRLPEAVGDLWPSTDNDLMVWAGAEATIARAIRRHARTVRSISAGRCQVLNYWKLGEPEGNFSYMA